MEDFFFEGIFWWNFLGEIFLAGYFWEDIWEDFLGGILCLDWNLLVNQDFVSIEMRRKDKNLDP